MALKQLDDAPLELRQPASRKTHEYETVKRWLL
jgi:hypothetical protein